MFKSCHLGHVLHSIVMPGAEYAQVMRMLGNGRLEAMCIDGIKRLCHIRGKMRKKVWVNTVRRCGAAALNLHCTSSLALLLARSWSLWHKALCTFVQGLT